ncbi:hypothetical protein Selin_1462 [Desulfurispirillum indicum S5]|uniref:Lipoprotein n=1 Tax=Desulfurispirillum indicum (strain ATCC BAA-1389 / DSM 22839 / S5) TaxID=653733 RepID=E6W6V3_DESIS|nr:TraV family lipoprotein [Desulfurispirillum indicum]ADU66196.1 hypothetical protein Selin_1462 [Desulfurispirillum indicum S5]
MRYTLIAILLSTLTIISACGKKAPEPIVIEETAPAATQTSEDLYKEELFTTYRSLLAEPSTPMVVPPRTMRGYVVPHERIARNGSSTLIDEHYRYWQTGQAQWILEGLQRRGRE